MSLVQEISATVSCLKSKTILRWCLKLSKCVSLLQLSKKKKEKMQIYKNMSVKIKSISWITIVFFLNSRVLKQRKTKQVILLNCIMLRSYVSCPWNELPFSSQNWIWNRCHRPKFRFQLINNVTANRNT
jgi:hypothetical protein